MSYQNFIYPIVYLGIVFIAKCLYSYDFFKLKESENYEHKKQDLDENNSIFNRFYNQDDNQDYINDDYDDYDQEYTLVKQNDVLLSLLDTYYEYGYSQNLNSTLLARNASFIGTWETSKDSDIKNQFGFFEGQQGKVKLDFLDKRLRDEENGKYYLEFGVAQFLFYDPQWYDQKIAYGYLNLPKNEYNEDTNTFDGENSGFIFHPYDHLYKAKEYWQNWCNATYNIQIINKEKEGEMITNVDQIEIKYYMENYNDSNCTYNLQGTFQYDSYNYTLQSLYYCLFMSGIALFQLLSVVRLIKYFSESEQESNKLSLITLGFCTIYDAYLCLANLYLSLLQSDQIYFFIIPAFLLFVLSTIFEMRLMVIVWKARYYPSFETQSDIRRGITMFYAKFYVSLMVFLISMYYLYIFNWFSVWIAFMLMPQIVHNAMRGNNPRFYYWYVFGLLFSRVSYPLYFRGCPDNIRDYKPSPEFCTAYTAITLFQILILFLQYKLGPRFFIPKCFLPYQHVYVKKVEIDTNLPDEEQDDCAICLTHLYLDPSQYSENIDNVQVNFEQMNQQMQENILSTQQSQNSEQISQKNEDDDIQENNNKNNITNNNNDNNNKDIINQDSKQNQKINTQSNDSEFQSDILGSQQNDLQTGLLSSDQKDQIKENNKENEKETKEGKNIKKVKIMITPCKHKFHISCLNDWIEIKLECPSCRAQLPPP